MSSSPPSAGTATQFGTPATLDTNISPDKQTPLVSIPPPPPLIPAFNYDPRHSRDAVLGLSERRRVGLEAVRIAEANEEPAPLSAKAEEFRPIFNIATSCAGGSRHSLGNFGPPQPLSSTIESNYQRGIFTLNESTSRAFLVSGVSATSSSSLYEYVAVSYKNFATLININASGLSKGVFSVEFTDWSDSKQALALTHSFLFRGQPVRTFNLSPKDLRMADDPGAVSNHAGEYTVSLIDVGGWKQTILGDDVLEVCETRGEVKAIIEVPALPGAVRSFRVEWLDSATKVMAISGLLISGYRAGIEAYEPDIVPRYARVGAHHHNNDEETRNIMQFLNQPRSILGTNPSDRNRGNHGFGDHNMIDVETIMLGQDVRTTVMLRNIPNRVDQPTLKQIIDETSVGQYDFMYLRIDFQNNCNVGYAFINFVDPMAILNFAQARAAVQGRDCLIQKFRNSSIMLERPDFRPKLFITGTGPDAGSEEEFPAADNFSKLQRSCQNAEHVGLYFPPIENAPSRPRDARRAPRNQQAGGFYTAPARGRIVFVSYHNAHRPVHSYSSSSAFD